MRRLALPAAALATMLLLAGCGGGDTNKGTLPEGVDDTASVPSTGAPSTPAPSESTKPGEPVTTTAPTTKAQVVVDPGNFANNPAVQGLVAKYPVYYKALVNRDDAAIKASFPAYFYLDVTTKIKQAKTNGWVMEPPGGVVVTGVTQRPHGVVRLNLCLSQRTQYWKPKSRTWVHVAPKGLPKVVDMVETGMGWSMYRELDPAQPFSCANVRFPA